MTARFIRNTLAAAMTVAALGAQAGTTTLSGYTYSPNNVNITVAPTGAYSHGAGGFSGTLSGYGAPWDTAVGALRTYCIELDEYFSPGTSYVNDYTILSAASYSGFDNAKVARLGKLLSWAFDGVGDDVDTSLESTALQLAIWNIRYDNDLSLSGGLFKDISSHAMLANDYLTQSQLLASANLNVYVLQSLNPGNHQDQVFWRPTPPGEQSNTSVPEPASLALVAIALAGLTLSRRRQA